MNRTLRVLHLPDIIGGHPPALARGERELGARALTLSCEPSVYEYPADIVVGQTSDATLKKMRDRWSAFKDVRESYDVFHFNFGASLLNFPRYGAILPDLGFYSKSAAKVMTWQGDDARLSYPDELDRSIAVETRRGRWNGAKESGQYLDRLRTLKRRIAIARSAAHCDHMFALNPDLLAQLPKEKTSFLPYAIEPPNVPPARSPDGDAGARRPMRFIHLSTSPIIKGTGIIEEALETAKRSANIEFEVVVKKPRHEALRRLSEADYLIDQVVLGWYGGTAVEAMYLGVPTIGRICAEQARLAGELGEELPIIRADADTLSATIIDLASDFQRQDVLAQQSREFANKWHAPARVAMTTLKFYNQILDRKS